MTLAIVNARGVPGALGALVGDRQFVTCHHVLFGGGAEPGGRIWALDDTRWPCARVPLGRALRGYCGLVTYRGAPCFVDAALGELDVDAALPALATVLGLPSPVDLPIGATVWKRGPLTGDTHGILADDRHFERPEIAGQLAHAPNQLRIVPRDRETQFSALGESGSAVLDAAGRFVGLIWGCTTYGEAVACPAGAVLAALGL